MKSPPAPKFHVIDGFLPEELVAALDAHVAADQQAMEPMELEFSPGKGYYGASRKLWVHNRSLGPLEPHFRSAVLDRLEDICAGTGFAPFPVARVETEVCAQRSGSFFAKHVDTDVGESSKSSTSDRVISAVYYFPREPLAFSGGELVLYDFTGITPVAQIEPRRNRLVAFPSFAQHEVTPLTGTEDSFEGARWSVNCWLHRGRAN